MSLPRAIARKAGLVYVSLTAPGITRIRRGRGLSYSLPGGKPVRAPRTLARIRTLAIPPAWTSVWICTNPRGHIQAVGLDARGRKQYRYHADWTAHRNRAKFDTLPDFAAALPSLRARIDRDLRLPGLPREKVAACILHLMDRTLIRVGNSEYARDNESYGLTTILNRHARVAGATITFKFKAKSGRACETTIESRRAAHIVRICQDLPGQELFCYRDEQGRIRDIGSADVNAYLARHSPHAFTAKDFRTWGGTCAAAQALYGCGPPSGPISAAALKRFELIAIRAAAESLGNTVAVCRKFYVHHALASAFARGRLHEAFARAASSGPRRLSTCERALLLLLRDQATARAAA